MEFFSSQGQWKVRKLMHTHWEKRRKSPFKCISGAVWSQCHLHQLPLLCGLLNWRGACIDWGFLKLSFILQMFIEHLLCSKPCHRYRGCGEKFSILKGFTVEERSSTSSDPHFVTITNLLTFKGWGGEKNQKIIWKCLERLRQILADIACRTLYHP